MATTTPETTPSPTATPTPTGRSVEIEMRMHASDGQQGMATITESGTTTIVRIEVFPVIGQLQPAFIQMAPCSSMGPVEFNLEPLDNGVSETALEMAFDDLMEFMGAAPVTGTTTAVTEEGRWVTVYKSENTVWVLTACGDLSQNVPAGTAAAATPTAAPTPAAAPTATITMAEITLGERNASGQSGKATLVASGTQTVVTIDLTPGPAGVAQPAHIHTGPCDPTGAVEFPLNSVVDGKSETTLDVSFSTLMSQTRSLNVHKSEAESTVIVACGGLTGG